MPKACIHFNLVFRVSLRPSPRARGYVHRVNCVKRHIYCNTIISPHILQHCKHLVSCEGKASTNLGFIERKSKLLGHVYTLRRRNFEKGSLYENLSNVFRFRKRSSNVAIAGDGKAWLIAPLRVTINKHVCQDGDLISESSVLKMFSICVHTETQSRRSQIPHEG